LIKFNFSKNKEVTLKIIYFLKIKNYWFFGFTLVLRPIATFW
jgi:hypothetical protein